MIYLWEELTPCSKTNTSCYLLFLTCVCSDTEGSFCTFSVLMLSNEWSLSACLWVVRGPGRESGQDEGPFPSLLQLSYLICLQSILFAPSEVVCKHPDISEHSEKTFCWTSKSNQEIGNPSVPSIASHLWLPTLLSIQSQRLHNPVFSRLEFEVLSWVVVRLWIWWTLSTSFLLKSSYARYQLCKTKEPQHTHFQMSALRRIVIQVDIFLILVLQRSEKK